MAGKTRITSKQKSARRRNIKVAQSARKKGVRKGKGAKGKAFGKAFGKRYKEARKFGASKSNAKRLAFEEGHKKAPGIAKKKAGAYARGKARRMGYTKKSHQRQFAQGFTRTLGKY